MALPFQEAFTGGAAVLANPPWTQANIGSSGKTLNTDGSGRGVASATDTTFDVMAFDNSNVYSNDQYGFVTAVGGLVSGTNYAEVMVRCSGSGASFQGYQLIADGDVASPGHTDLLKWVGGSSSVLFSFATSWAGGDVMRIDVVGTLITCYKNGVSIGTFNDTVSPITSGAPGCGVYNQVADTVVIDTFEGNSLGPAVVVAFVIPTKTRAGKPGSRTRRDTISNFVGAVTPVPFPVLAGLPVESRFVFLTKKRRRGRNGTITQVVALQAVMPPQPLRDSVVISQPKKRRRRTGEVQLIRPRIFTVVTVVSKRSHITVTKAIKRRKRGPDVNIVVGARRAPIVSSIRPYRPIEVVTQRKRHKRVSNVTLITGALVFTYSVRPIEPIAIVSPKKRHRRGGDVTIVRAKRSAAAQTKRPNRPVQVLAKKHRRNGRVIQVSAIFAQSISREQTQPLIIAAKNRRRKRVGDASVVTGARRAVLVSSARIQKQSILVLPKKRHRRGGGTIFITGALVFTYSIAPAKPRILVLPKKRHGRIGNITLVTGARRAVVLITKVPTKAIVRPAPRRKTRHTGVLLRRPSRLSTTIPAKRPNKPVLLRAKRKHKRLTPICRIVARPSKGFRIPIDTSGFTFNLLGVVLSLSQDVIVKNINLSPRIYAVDLVTQIRDIRASIPIIRD